MGSALSRQNILDKQPNWLVPPSRWRPHRCSHPPVRYRTPTPYPKEDRKRVEEHIQTTYVPVSEKAIVIEIPVASHVEVAGHPRRRKPAQQRKALVENQQPGRTVTWEPSPRLNRFERVP
ncbi:hypothetical protein N0V88_006374 [Collariella sp. IMI 366227]|nr:hypothetical protein N0V88_006374 [Collariella sp. IMI 366227]